MSRQRHQLAALEAQLGQLNPESVLGRGYSLVRDAEGRIVRQADNLSAGDRLEIRFASGAADVSVERVKP